MPIDAEIPLIDSSCGEDPSSSLQLFIKNLRQEVNDVRKDLEELQDSFNSLKYSEESSSRSESIVSFSTVQVRKYNVTMGDYRSGHQCPLTLGWEHGPSRTYDIDTFSKKKGRQRRNRLERLPLYKRQDRLRAMGYSKEEIAQTSRKRLIQLALNCAFSNDSFPPTATILPREEDVPLVYQHGSSLKDFQRMEDRVASNEDIDVVEKIMNAGKNSNTSIIDTPIHTKNSANAA